MTWPIAVDTKHSASAVKALTLLVLLGLASAVLVGLAGCGAGTSKLAPTEAEPTTAPVLSSSATTVRLGSNAQLSAKANGVDVVGGTWSVTGGAASGTVGTDGVYHAPLSMPNNSTVSLSFAYEGNVSALQIQLAAKIATVSAVTPNVIRAGVTAVAVQGSDFTPGAQVVVGGVNMPTKVIDANNLAATVTIGNGASSKVSLSVLNQGTDQVASDAVPISVDSNPIILSASASVVRLTSSATLSAMSGGALVTNGTWSLQGGPSDGTVTPSGVYTAPSTMPTSSVATAVFAYEGQVFSLPVNLGAPVASVTAIEPNTIKYGSNSVTIVGSNFESSAELLVNGTPTPVTVLDSSHLSATIAVSDPNAKTVSLSVINQGPLQASSNTTMLSVKSDPILLASSIPSVQLNGSATLTATIDGVALTGGTWAVVGGAGSGIISADGVYTAPGSMPSSTQAVVMFTLAGSSSQLQLTLLGVAPTVTSITPNVIGVGTTPVKVQGTGFASTAQLLINGSAVPTQVVDSAHLVGMVTVNATSGSSVSLAVANQGPGQVTSSVTQLAVHVDQLQVFPEVASVGNQTLTLTGVVIPAGASVMLDGRAMAITGNLPSNNIIVNGYLVPWRTGSVALNVLAADGSLVASTTLPITATAVTYEAAARFLTQAGFGPRPGLIEHVQQIGFDAFLTEQFAAPGLTYGTDPYRQYLTSVATDVPVLRLRTAWALQNILTRSGIDTMASQVPWETTLERDAFGSYRQLLLDASSDLSMGLFINLAGNDASTDPNHEPNQNFGREIMQVFTTGTLMLNEDGTTKVDASGQTTNSYDQNTVLALSKAFTGWEVPAPVNSLYTLFGYDFSQPLAADETRHDHSAKVLFGNITLPAGQSITQDRDAALDAVFNHPNVAPYVSKLLIQKFVKSAPSPAYVTRIAAVFEDDGHGTRGNMQAVIRAILLDSEARAGDTTGDVTDGFVQDPMFFLTFSMNVLQRPGSDDQTNYIPKELGESMWLPTTVFGFYSPTYTVPGTSIVSPEFALLNNISVLQRSQMLWGLISSSLPGFSDSQAEQNSWLYTTFPDVGSELDALDHMVYFGKMDPNVKASILRYCSQQPQQDKLTQFQLATFLALNSDAYMVSH